MRLTKAIIRNLTENLIDDVMKERHEALIAEEKALGDKVYHHFVGQYLDTINTLPSGYFARLDQIKMVIRGTKNKENLQYGRVQTYFSEGSWKVRIFTNWGQHWFSLSKAVRVPHAYATGGFELKAGTRLNKEAYELAAKWTTLYEDVSSLLKAVAGATTSCTTVKKLQENYPELAEFLPEQEKQAQGLAVSPARVKKLISCTKEGSCPKVKKTERPEVIAL